MPEHELKNAYIGEYHEGWQPGANTICYYKFDNNLSDSSGNGHDMSWNTSSSYGTTVDGATYANFTGSTWTNYLNGFPYDPSAYTISFWMNYPAYSSGGAGVIIDYWYADGSNIPLRIQDKGSQLNIGGVTLTPSINTRHQYTISYSSGTATIYIDGSSTGQTFSALAAGTARLIFGNEGGSSYSSYHAGRGMLSEFIIENKARTAQEIADYYNQTKANYGWQPGANTLAYLPLATDITDQTGNYTLTSQNITFSDNKAIFNSSGTSCITFPATMTYNAFTLHMIVKFNSVGANNYQVLWRHSDSSGYDNSRCYPTGYSQGINFALCGVNDQTSLAYPDTTNEHLYSVVIQPSGSSQTKMDFYVDGTKIYSQTRNNQSYANAQLSIGNRWYNMNEGLNGTMREVILESTYRTDAEVLALAQQYGFASTQTVQTFDFQNDGDLGWTGYSIGYGTPDYVTGQGRKIGTSSSDSYQGGITIPNSVFQGELKSIKIYWYKPETTASYSGSAVGICNQNQSTNCEYGRSGSGGGININGTRISAIDPTGEITTEWIMESNGDLTVKINDTSYNVGSNASTFKDLRTNKTLYIEMGRWDKPAHYIRKIEITTA